MPKFLTREEEKATYACTMCGEECDDCDWTGDFYACSDCTTVEVLDVEDYDF